MSGAPHCMHTNGRPGGWLLLPVAPRSNARSRHGDAGVSTPCACGTQPASPAMLPHEALEHLRTVMETGAVVDTVGIAGPGDPFAVPDRTLETLHLVRAAYPHITLCVTTNGLGVASHAAALAGLGVSHVTLLMDAVDPELVDTLYAWIRPGTRTLRPGEGASLLVDEQAVALAALVRAGIEVTVCVTVYPGINDSHVGDIAAAAKALGASGIYVVPFVPAEDATGPVPAADAATMDAARNAAAACLPVLDASARDGLPVARRTDPGCGEPVAVTAGSGLPLPGGDRPYVAVASSDGFDVDEHLGHARQFLVYGPKDGPASGPSADRMTGPVELLGVRPAPPAGSGDARWEALAAVLSDCAYLLVSSAGQRPVEYLAGKGLRVIQTEDNIEGLVDVLYGGGKKGRKRGKGRTV